MSWVKTIQLQYWSHHRYVLCHRRIPSDGFHRREKAELSCRVSYKIKSRRGLAVCFKITPQAFHGDKPILLFFSPNPPRKQGEKIKLAVVIVVEIQQVVHVQLYQLRWTGGVVVSFISCSAFACTNAKLTSYKPT